MDDLNEINTSSTTDAAHRAREWRSVQRQSPTWVESERERCRTTGARLRSDPDYVDRIAQRRKDRRTYRLVKAILLYLPKIYVDEDYESGELLYLKLPETFGIPFCHPVCWNVADEFDVEQIRKTHFTPVQMRAMWRAIRVLSREWAERDPTQLQLDSQSEDSSSSSGEEESV